MKEGNDHKYAQLIGLSDENFYAKLIYTFYLKYIYII